MESNTPHAEPSQTASTRQRAVIEIVDGELKIFPIANSDKEAEEILNTILLWKSDA